MPLTLRLKTTSTIPICVQGVIPEVTKHLSLSEIGEILIRRGNRQHFLSELFELSGTHNDDAHCWDGDLASVHWIGSKMSSGNIRIAGSCGRHLGSQMRGGHIEVLGNASDFVACENRGGVVRVHGDAGDWVGAAYPGTQSGSDGGTLLIDGNVGGGLGYGMRRGTIAVGGNVGNLAGWNMLAGTILMGGRWGKMTGRGMKRGTLVSTRATTAEHNIRQLPASFTIGAKRTPVFLNVLQNWMKKHNFSLVSESRDSWRQFHGDHLKGGRGEVFVCSQE